jgi:hypothetical protein
MTFTVRYKLQFAVEFLRFPLDQQTKIAEFIALYKQVGLDDFSKYQGKFNCTWDTLNENDPKFVYARENCLWHYHIGLPYYTPGVQHDTSDWLLHFQWMNWPVRATHIELVDIYKHYTWDGKFYIPPPATLVSQPPAEPAQDTTA